MGYNTVIVALNDATSDIENDPEIGKKIARAMSSRFSSDLPIEIAAKSHCNALTVLGTEHSSAFIPYIVGGNSGHQIDGVVLDYALKGDWQTKELRLLEKLADKLGFRLVKKKDK